MSGWLIFFRRDTVERTPAWHQRLSFQAVGIAFGILLLAGGPGCSFIFTRGPSALPPEPARSAPSECTESNAAPIADTVLAVALLTFATWAVVEAAQPCPHPPQTTDSGCWNELAYFPAAGAGLLGALFTSSAVVGYSHTSNCRAARTPHALDGSTPTLGPGVRRRMTEHCILTGDVPRVCALDLGLREPLHSGTQP